MVDVAVIGFQKCGTSSIRNWLGQQPELDVYLEEIAPFQSCANTFLQGYEGKKRTKKIENWINTDNYYEGNELHSQKRQKVVVSPSYSLLDYDGTAYNLSKHNPDMKIIYLTRNRVDRAYSAWNMAQNTTWEDRPFFDAIMDCIDEPFDYHNYEKDTWLRHNYIDAGRYEEVYRTYQNYFPALHIFGMPLRELNHRRNEIRSFLGLPNIETEVVEIKNKGIEYNEKVRRAHYVLLKAYYDNIGELEYE